MMFFSKRKSTENALKQRQEWYRSLFRHQSDPLFALDRNTGAIIEANDAACQIYGYTIDELMRMKGTDLVAEPEKTRHADEEAEANRERMPVRTHKARDGRVFPVEITSNAIILDNREVELMSVRDITERKLAEQALIESEEKFRLLYTSMNQGLALHEIVLDDNGKPVDFIILDINESYTRLYGITREMAVGKRITEVMPDVDQYQISLYGEVALTGNPRYVEHYHESSGKYYSTYSYSPKKYQFAILISDITERKNIEGKIEYLCFHDQLTGLYNRRFYEEELTRLDTQRNYPLTIVMGDVNGLKLVNDSFGHTVGDELLKKSAEMIRKGCRADDIIARIGGDEFVILLPKTDMFQAEVIIKRINELLSKEKVNAIDISLSFGYETKLNADERIEDVFKRTEEHMYYNKLLESPIIKGKTVDRIIRTLYEKSKREEQHSQRVSLLCERMGRVLGLPENKVKELKTVGMLYDIGEVAIDASLLNKPGKLTEDEWNKIKRHPEIGYRILSTINEMSGMAQYVLDHHERWDGKGYPRDLKGEDIAFESRIMAIADAYDAMTNFRTYRSVLTKEEALAELEKNAGVQFDPDLVKAFIGMMSEN